MLVPLSWLKEYVDIDVTPEELEKKLFDGGFEVEERYQVGKDISNVVVGLVEGCEPIPETHLHVCQVNAGEHGTMQICCGADNVHTGGKFPVALPGASVYATAKDRSAGCAAAAHARIPVRRHTCGTCRSQGPIPRRGVFLPPESCPFQRFRYPLRRTPHRSAHPDLWRGRNGAYALRP